MRSLVFGGLLVGFALTAVSQTAKKPLDHDVYDIWRALRGQSLSDDGKWIAYSVGPAVGDGEFFVEGVQGTPQYKVPRAGQAKFSKDGNFLVAIVSPAKADVDKAKKEKKKPNEMPKSSVVVLDLRTGQTTTLERATSYTMAADGGNWVAYKPEPLPEKPATPPTAGTPPAEKPAEKPKDDKPQKKKDHAVGGEIVLRDLATGKETKIADVSDFSFSDDDDQFIYTVSTKTGEGDGVFCRNLKTGETTTVMQGMANYRSVDAHTATNAIAFLTDKNDYKSDKPLLELYVWKPGAKEATLVAKSGSEGLPKDWILSNGGVRFSDSGKRVFFSTVPKPVEEKKDETPDDEKSTLDVWSWTDPELQPMQLLRVAQERNRTYEAYCDLASGKLVQYESKALQNVTVTSKGDGEYGIGTDNRPYRQLASWDTDYSDVYVVDMKTGSARMALTKVDDVPSASPSGKFGVWYDTETRQYKSLELATLKAVTFTQGIKFPLYDEMDDHPAPAPPHGIGGWTADGSKVLVYDRFDIWLCDPRGADQPKCLTQGTGRARSTRLRIGLRDPDANGVDLSKPVYLSAFHEGTRDSGYYRLNPNGLERLVVMPKSFGALSKAKNAEVYAFTREDFADPRDLYVSGPNLADMRKVSDTNPQQKDYNWCTVEMVNWTSLDGINLEGLLYKPEGFDPGKKYPMIVYFYERDSDNLHRYTPPAPSASTINPTWFASRGYLVFIPDIPYQIGYPGPSAVKAILPGVTSLVSRGYVDAKHMGLQGQSWGGYQTAYLVTQTDMFACAGAGAAVSNMFSAYGGIRYGSGMVRQFQYEKGQSRIGGTMWDKPLQYIENSPIFWVDKIKTPLLMMNNDQDDAVPWTQGIELFTAMRRLQKPCWMLVYNGEGHNLMKRPNRKDLSIRLGQFFDHYLMGKPAPAWMVEGVPAVQKGKVNPLGG